jgi:glycosyltransferase involved in cell wall biosynthesis
MARGVPVIAADRGALTEMLADGDGGVLFDPDDPRALPAWIDRLIADPTIIDAWAARLPAIKSADVHAAEIDAVYAELLAARRGSP